VTLAEILQQPLSTSPSTVETLDAAVVLGAPIGKGPTLAAPLAERLDAGADLYHRGLARTVCITGKPSEADAMLTRLRAARIPEDAMRVDREAATTRDNAAHTSAILRRDGLESAWIVTQPFHLRRACFWFRRFGIDARPWLIAGGLPPRVIWLVREYAAWGRVGLDLLVK
jgi:uncharacterized SAM-binding protein YcdF (DUF218 family)